MTGLLNATFGNAVEMIVAIQPFDQIGQGYPLVNVYIAMENHHS